ncbi:hypothetical protein BHM03_00018197 [Ensete ventricosum]|uniref:Uncharacterized protein n=1 Tax=Ensete ventricosum TaxID=4639 RepID=A0A445MF32_ENSVE|nr:hypothetical protein BHM03_00018197 [Ensete ventricosum]
MSSSSSSNVRSALSTSSEGTRSGNPYSSVSGSSSPGMPSSIDAKSLRDLEVMKSCHDIASVVTEGSLRSIRERYSISEEYALQAPSPDQRPYNTESSEFSISVDALEANFCFPSIPPSWNALGGGGFLQAGRVLRPLGLQVPHQKQRRSVWRPIGSAVSEQASTTRLGKQVKIAVKKHKSHHGEESSQATARGKEPTTSTKGDASPTYRRPKSMKDLCNTRVRKDDKGYYVLQIADSAPKDLDASILQAVDRVWMGATSDGSGVLEYRYRVALARFKARYPDLEVDSDPFTEKPEDNLVPMETRQEFDNSVPAEE